MLVYESLHVAIIGAGKVGSVLACALHRCGHEIISVASRSLDSAIKLANMVGARPIDDIARSVDGSDVVFLTVPDGAIKDTCKVISSGGKLKPKSFVFHTSGVLDSEVLKSAKEKGAYVASIHPLQSFASIEESLENLSETFFAIEGDTEGVECGKELVTQMGGYLLNIPPEIKPLYHAGACVASNFVVSIIRMAVELFELAGIDADSAFKALTPLVKGTFKNIGSLGVPHALTGPISRGDIETLGRHLEVLKRYDRELLLVYCELGKYTTKVAVEKGTIDQVTEKALLDFFKSWRCKN
jgi:predicted short-subunit dehydrogenase-like oxidoreductase (DUF2520 family)